MNNLFEPWEDDVIINGRNEGLSYEEIRKYLQERNSERTQESIRKRHSRLREQEEPKKESGKTTRSFLRYMKDPKTFEEAANYFNITQAEIRKRIRDLESSGFQFEIIGDDHIVYVQDPAKELGKPLDNYAIPEADEDEFLIGAIADTHLVSKMDRVDLIHDFYNYCKSLGVSMVFHAGDVGDGSGKIYRGHRFELRSIGYDNHLNYIVNKYPYVPGITTYAIPGNHDDGYYADFGGDVLAGVAKERDDFVYLPNNRTRIRLGPEEAPLYVLLQHGIRGATKIISYRLQEYVEAQNNIFDREVDVLILGHYHQLFHIKYQGILGVMPGGFQSSTRLSLRLPQPPCLAGTIIKLKRNSKANTFEVIERDYKVKSNSYIIT